MDFAPGWTTVGKRASETWWRVPVRVVEGASELRRLSGARGKHKQSARSAQRSMIAWARPQSDCGPPSTGQAALALNPCFGLGTIASTISRTEAGKHDDRKHALEHAHCVAQNCLSIARTQFGPGFELESTLSTLAPIFRVGERVELCLL